MPPSPVSRPRDEGTGSSSPPAVAHCRTSTFVLFYKRMWPWLPQLRIHCQLHNLEPGA